MQSVPFTNNVVSSNPAHGEVYSIQHYVIKVVRFPPGTPVSPTNKTEHHEITEILLKVALNTKKNGYGPLCPREENIFSLMKKKYLQTFKRYNYN
jgi:hypothetical protein